MRDVIFRPRAAHDLDTIADYTTAEWGEPQAKRYADAIRRKIAFVAEFPGAGNEGIGLPSGYRKIASGSHRIIYRVTECNLIVVRVLHERQDVLDDIQDS